MMIGPVYHGTDKSFDTFLPKEGKTRKSNQQLDFGSHFTDSSDYAKKYSHTGQIKTGYLSIENPLDLIKAVWYKGEDGFDQVLKLSLLLKFKPLNDEYRTLDGKKMPQRQVVIITQQMLDNKPPRKVRDSLIEAGFDGIIYEPYNRVGAYKEYVKHPKSYIALFPDQIHLTEKFQEKYQYVDDPSFVKSILKDNSSLLKAISGPIELLETLNKLFYRYGLIFSPDEQLGMEWTHGDVGIQLGFIYESGDIVIICDPSQLIDIFESTEFEYFTNVVMSIVSHELIHRHQLSVTPYEYQITKKDLGNSNFAYLSNPKEIDAHASEAVWELMNLGYNNEKIRSWLSNSSQLKDHAFESTALWKYYDYYGRYVGESDEDPEVWKRFLKRMYDFAIQRSNLSETTMKPKTLVVCDVQPHDVGKHIRFNMDHFAEYVNSFSNVLVFFNGLDYGWESQDEMKDYYSEIGIDISNCEFYDKGYAFLRDLMDADTYIPDEDVVSILKLMKSRGIFDSSDIDEEILAKSSLSEYLDIDDLQNYPFYYPEDLGDKISSLGPFILIGGGKDECLRELQLVCDTEDANYILNKQFIYG